MGLNLIDSAARRASVFADAALELLYPTRCVGCEMPGELLCDECRVSLPWIEQRLACPVCGAAFGKLTCSGCEGDWETRAVVSALGFTDAAPRMATCLKDYHELRLAPVNAAAILTALEEASAWPARDGKPRFDASEIDAVCFVPATAEAYARRGYDHMELTARELAGMLGLPLADVLVRRKASDQRGLGREEGREPRRHHERRRGRLGPASASCRRRRDHRRLPAGGGARPSCPRSGAGHGLLAHPRLVARPPDRRARLALPCFHRPRAPHPPGKKPLRTRRSPRFRCARIKAFIPGQTRRAAGYNRGVLLRSVVAGRARRALSPR